jgi:hypothetical protein
MKINQLLLVLPFLLLFNSVGLAQNSQCTLDIANLPAATELLGFQLGMTKEQVKARVPQVVFGKKDDFGVSKTTINPYFDPRIDKSSFEGVRSISLDFLDEHLISLWIGYDGAYKTPTVDGFVKAVSQSLHLPNAWTPWRTRGQQMRCANFQLTVIMVADGPSFRILDLAGDDNVAKRREEKEEQSSAEVIKEPEQIVADKQTKIYFPAGCKPSKEIPEADLIIFKTIDEADKAGFKASRECQ